MDILITPELLQREWVEMFGDKLVLRRVESLNQTEGYSEHDGPRVEVDDIDQANVATSRTIPDTLGHIGFDGELHRPVIDIDMPAWLFESSTPGHHHLVIDRQMPFDDLVKLLRVMAEVGIVEPGFVAATERRGYSSMRLPWVKKGQTP